MSNKFPPLLNRQLMVAKTIPTFQKAKDEAFVELKAFVRNEVQQNGRSAHRIMMSKAILLPALYGCAYTALMLWGKNDWVYYGAYLSMGLLLVFIFLNLIHDAVHGCLFRQKWLNHLYVHFFDFMGANSYVWKLRHTRLHHNFANVMGWDSDIEQSPLARIFPHEVPVNKHRYQHIYLPLLYPLYLANWLLVRDFKDYFNKKKIIWKIADLPRLEYVKLFLFKAIFLTYVLIVPWLVLKVSFWQVLGGFCVLLFSASIFSLMVLLSPHANTYAQFPLPNEQQQMDHTWFMHQLLTTNDVSHHNWFVRYFMGSFNFHVIHHLFPNLCHVHYPRVTAELCRLAQQHNLPYRSHPLLHTLKAHYLLLKHNGTQENIFEEVM